MGEPNKLQCDPENGQQEEPVRPSLGEGITNAFSKAGEGITNAFSKAGEGILGAGSAMKDSAKKVGEGVQSLVTPGQERQKKNRKKKNPQRAKNEKNFNKKYHPIPREEPKDTNIVGNITKLLPANTFLMFQTLAPLSTNDGNCHKPEIIMTSVMLVILAMTCMLVCFTDTIQFNGKVYHGLVTWSGLWNPSFKGDPCFVDLRQYEVTLAQFYIARRQYKGDKRHARMNGLEVPPKPIEPVKPSGPHVTGSTYSSGNSQYELNLTDFLHAVLSAMAFGTLTMLTNPVSTCFYPNIPSTVVKTLPLLVGFVISAIFAFSPPARNGIAHPLSPKVPSQMDNFKPADPKGVMHGPQLPPQPPGKGNEAAKSHGKPDDDDDDDSVIASAKKIFGKFLGSSYHSDSGSPPGHHGLDGMKGFLNKYGDEIKQEVAKVGHGLENELKKEASHLMGRAGSGVAQLSKEVHVPLAIQEAAKSPIAEAMLTSLVNGAGAGHPALAAAAQSAYAQGAKDAALRIHQDIQTATSGPLAGLSRQSSMALTRANSMLQSAGSSLSLSPHDAHDALFNQAAQVLQRSGLASPLHSPGSEAAIALATGQALMQAGFLPGTQSPQAHALNAFAQGIGNLNLNSANALIKDIGSLVQQGGKSFTEVQDELARQQLAFTQGLNAQLQTLYSPGTSVAQDLAGLIHNGSQTLNQIQGQVEQQQAAISNGAFTANLASAVAREAGTLLQEGADHGMTGVQDELSRQKAAGVQRMDMQVQSIAQPVSSLAQDVTSLAQQGSQAMSTVTGDLMKQKAVLTQEVNIQVRALSTPATSVAHDIAALGTPGSQGFSQLRDEASQKLREGVNSQFVESLARDMAQGMSTRIRQGTDQAIAMAPVQEHISGLEQQLQSAYQPAASVAIDVASLLQQGSQMHTQLARQQSAFMSQGLNAAQVQAMAMPQRQASGQFNQPLQIAQQVVETHMRRLASLPPQSPSQLGAAMISTVQPAASLTINTLVESRPAQQIVESSRNLRDNASLIIEEVTDEASAGQRSVDGLRRASSQLPTAELLAQASAMEPSASQVRTASSEIVASTSEAAERALAGTPILREKPESYEIVDSIPTEEITSESETEGRGEFRVGPFSLQVQMKQK